MKNVPVKIGDTVVCIDDDSDNEDFGASGIVFEGRHDLTLGKEYVVEGVDMRHVPKKNTHWKRGKEFRDVQAAWIMIKLKGITKECWFKHFEVV